MTGETAEPTSTKNPAPFSVSTINAKQESTFSKTMVYGDNTALPRPHLSDDILEMKQIGELNVGPQSHRTYSNDEDLDIDRGNKILPKALDSKNSHRGRSQKSHRSNASRRASTGLCFDQCVVTQIDLGAEEPSFDDPCEYGPGSVFVLNEDEPHPFRMGAALEQSEDVALDSKSPHAR